MQDVGESVETDLAALAIGLLTGAVTSFGQETATGVVRLVREGLAATPQGQAALAGVAAAPGDEGARREAERVLREELAADPGFQQTLAARLNVSTTHMTNVVTVNGTKMRGNQVSLGPITVNKPNTTAGLLGLAAALAVVAALLVYGVVQLVGDGPESDGGNGGRARARALSAVEAERMLPGLTDLSGAWETSQPAHLTENGTKCHNALAEYESQERDGSGLSDLKVRYDTFACPDTAIAAQGFAEITQNATNPGSRKEKPFPSRTLGDQSATSAYEVKDEEMADPTQVGSHLMWRARVGTVLIEMHYGPVRDGVGSEKQAEELMRLMCDRAREAQERG
ncbi:hypothetical protein [Streptomyces sp. Ncost-T10-10d]|uniref:hypothetical protein n=2 Tax=unclassified Streptomyces TaxID=2593676 RepID=UPI000B85CA44|nr:hypothetical protein [Streptomyces sp. Ncost-T10-10d]